MKKVFILIIVSFSISAYAQSLSTLFGGKGTTKKAKMEEARNAVIAEDFKHAIEVYSGLIAEEGQDKNTKGDLLAEYAYALALSHNFDFALSYIDRARLVKSKYTDFYTRQILNIMGYPTLASRFQIKEVPTWLIADYKTLNSSNSVKNIDTTKVPRKELDRAYKLIVKKQYVRSIIILYRLEQSYPEAYIIPAVNSYAWECIGDSSQAELCLEKAIQIMDEEGQTEQRDSYAQHLSSLKNNKTVPIFEHNGRFAPRLCTCIGTYAAKGILSLNGRIGLYTNDLFSSSMNVSISRSNEQFSYNVGLSAYKTWRIFMGGLGVSYLFGGGEGSFNLSPCVGLTFLNEKKTSSLDIMFNCYVPFSSSGKFSYGITIGKTIYL